MIEDDLINIKYNIIYKLYTYIIQNFDGFFLFFLGLDLENSRL